MNNIIEIDNFFPEIIQKQIQSKFDQPTINWKYMKYSSYTSNKAGIEHQKKDPLIIETDSFVCSLDGNDGNLNSKDQTLINQFIHSINIKAGIQVKNIIRMRANFLSCKNLDNESYSPPHVDLYEPHYTLIYYVNDATAETILFNEFYNGDVNHNKKTIYKKVTPKKGKAIIFDGLRYHSVSNANFHNRLVININFI